MTSEIGFVCLVLALAGAIYSAGAWAIGIRRQRPVIIASARQAMLAVAGLTTLAVLGLLTALLTHNFGLQYVYAYTSRAMPTIYLIASLWAGNDGSLLFWAWLLALFSLVVVYRRRSANRELIPHTALILMVVQVFFLLLLVATSNPFEARAVVPWDGRGINPLLENFGMIVHPPLLLAGYVVVAVPFAFAVAALLKRQLNNAWVVATRRWILAAWLLLGAGNLIGAWWAYVELGWGGYWAWDSVENAGLMPWLTATVFLHSMLMQRWRGIFRVWNMTLVIVTFGLVIFGTFLTRSGVLAAVSVHSFPESTMGPYFITFMAVTVLGALGLMLWRYNELKGEVEMESWISREGSFLLNNLLLVGATIVILIATIFPFITSASGKNMVILDPEWYDRAVGPILLVIVLLIGICCVIGWRRANLRTLLRQLAVPLALAAVLGIVLAAVGLGAWQAALGYAVCAFVGTSVLVVWIREVRARRAGDNPVGAWWGLLKRQKPRYGAYLVHLGIVLITVGIIGSSFFGAQHEVTLKVGETVTVKDYTLTFQGIFLDETPDKQIIRAEMGVTRGGRKLPLMAPEKYYHRSLEGQSVTEVAIRSTAVADLYVILGGLSEDGETVDFEILVNPLVIWIWIGGGVFLAGGLLAFWGDRRKTGGAITAETDADDK